MTKILIVEDHDDLARGLANNLEIEGFETEIASDGPTGLKRAKDSRPDLVILDLMLPGMDGYRVLSQLRDEGDTVPVLILTARTAEHDKVRGFREGADDYVTKPFGLLELIGRVHALMRRSSRARQIEGASSFRFGDVEITPGTHDVVVNGVPVTLRPKEFDLLMALARRKGNVVGRLELLREVWGYDSGVVSRTVDTHVGELRRKLEKDPAAPRHILTVRKTGYRLQPG
ncbi:MAG TPA: response regulator transcription factor [Gemmatimonadaceae bacterium]|nr:response regulator transcription factor [Gemmatimonadaceae bacterium]